MFFFLYCLVLLDTVRDYSIWYQISALTISFYEEKLLNLQRLNSVSFSCLSLCDFHKAHLDHQLQVTNFFIVLRLFLCTKICKRFPALPFNRDFSKSQLNSKISSNILFNVYHSLMFNFTFNSRLIIIQRRDLMPDKFHLWQASRKEFNGLRLPHHKF